MSTLQKKRSKIIQKKDTERNIEIENPISKDIIEDLVNIQQEDLSVEDKNHEKEYLQDDNELNSTIENSKKVHQYILDLKNELKNVDNFDNSQISKNLDMNSEQLNSPIFSKLSVQPTFQLNMVLKDFNNTKVFYKKKLGFNLINENQDILLVFKSGDVILSFSNESRIKIKNLPQSAEIILKTKINLQDFLQLCKDINIEIIDLGKNTVPDYVKIKDPNGYIFSILN